MELLRTPRLMLRRWEDVRSQAVAARLGMRDEGTTDRWFGLTARQFSKTIAAGNDGDCPAPTPPGHREP
jgi:hypothetical protein